MIQFLLRLCTLFSLSSLSLQWCYRATYYQRGSQINEIDWSPDGQYIAVCSKQKQVSVISFATSNVIWLDTFPNQVKTVKFSKTGKWLAAGQLDSDTVRIYNVPSFTLYKEFSAQHTSTTDTIFELDFNSDDTRLITCAKDGHINQYNLVTDINQWKSPLDIGKDVLACKFADNDKIGAYCDGQMFLLRFNDGFIQKKVGRGGITSVDFRPGGHRYLYGGCTDNKLYLHETIANTVTNAIGTNDDLYSVSHSKDSTFIATGGKGGHINVINTTVVATLTKQEYFKRSGTDVTSVKVSYNSNYIAAGNKVGTIDIFARHCEGCPTGYYVNMSSCRSCALDLLGCASCLNSTVCFTCFSGYYYNSVAKNCIICGNALPGCLTCLSSTVCIECSSPFYKVGNTCANCALSTPNCEQCYNNGSCIKCSYNTYLTPTRTCSLCSVAIPRCIKCYPEYNASSATNSTLYCRQCTLGYYASQTQCLACSANCITCLSTNVCIACALQYRMSGTTCVRCSQYCQACNQTDTCFQCQHSTFLTAGGTCSLCTYPCATCASAATSCTSCTLGFYLSGTSCLNCSGCPFCNPFNGTCLSCPLGQYISPPTVTTCTNCLNTTSKCAICQGSTCLLCERNYYLTGTGTCALTATLANCEIYRKNSTTQCEHCRQGFYVSYTSGVGTCEACSKECFSCDGATTCIQCHIGYYLVTANSTCMVCENNCKTCNSSTECLSCGDEYYLAGTQCLVCWSIIPFCNSCLNSTHCLDCRIGYKLASDSLQCIQCTSPCASCNLTACLSCEPGFFYQTNSCTRCPQNCSTCTSLLICTSCVTGFAVNPSNICTPCQNMFPNCQVCSNTTCVVCRDYFIFNSSSSTCDSCSAAITNCVNCLPNGQCTSCVVGFYPSSDRLSCLNCSVAMPWCEKCVSGTVCDECRTGYYLSSASQCSLCINGCAVCSSAGTCDICDSGFVKSGTSCISCSQHVLGCEVCTLGSGCSFCQLGYYLFSSTSCLLCKSALAGCIACNSSSVCISCDAGYFLNSTSKCQQCTYGCQACNQTTGQCISCLSGFFFNATSQCQLCSQKYAFCDICDSTSCLRCDSGNYLLSGSCTTCSTLQSPCILCNSSACLQCQTGFYLDPAGSCIICPIVGCQACNQLGTLCLSCQNLYYKTGSTCSLCSSMDLGCLSCNGLNSCILCKSGYYLHTNGTCMLCQGKFPGCQICSTTRCQVCDSNYFHNTTAIAGDCVSCQTFIPGCSLCVDQTMCLLCESGYYMLNNVCFSCTVISNCLICSDSVNCHFCAVGYYQFNGQCLSCSDAIVGCFSCSAPNLCISCSGSYTESGGICVEMKGVPPKQYSQVYLKTQYVNKTHLKHILYSVDIYFNQIEQNWNSSVNIEYLIPPSTKNSLIILAVEWGRSIPLNSLIFFTNNPFGELEDSILNNSMPLISNFTKRRFLLTLEQLNIKINFNMKQSVISEILPQLDTNGQDLALDYKLNEPQFYREIIKNQKHFFYLFGVVVTAFLLIAYLIKVCCVLPKTNDAGQIIPHILLTKVGAMVIYPTLGGYINYCYGFTYVDMPFFNQYLAQLLSNMADESPSSYKMFFQNLNIVSTYLLPLSIFSILFVPLTFYAMYRNSKYSADKRTVKTESFSSISKQSPENESTGQIRVKTPRNRVGNRAIVFREYVYNVFSAGLFFYSFLNIVGMILNPSSVVSYSGFFYILGSLVFLLIVADSLRQYTAQKTKFHKVRIALKSSLMALMFLSPVPIFAAMALIDAFFIYKEHSCKAKLFVTPKAWIVSNALCLLSYGSLIFLPSVWIGLIVSAVSVIMSLCFDGYVQYFQFLQGEKIEDLINKINLLSRYNHTANNLLQHKEKREQTFEKTLNFYFEQSMKNQDQYETQRQGNIQIQGFNKNNKNSKQKSKKQQNKASTISDSTYMNSSQQSQIRNIKVKSKKIQPQVGSFSSSRLKLKQDQVYFYPNNKFK